MKKKPYINILIILFLFNITILPTAEGAQNMESKSSYRVKLEKINISKGVDKKDAIIIAQNYLIDKGLEKNCIIFWPKVKEGFLYDNSWTVDFPPSLKIIFRIPCSFQVHIDKRNGKIISAGWNK